jgi:hypothetical protein
MLLGFGLFVSTAQARVAEVFLFEGVEALSAGRFDGTTLSAEGEIRPGFQVERWAHDESKAFASVTYVNEKEIYIGSAQDGQVLLFNGETFSQVYKADGEKDQRVTSLLFHQKELWVAFAPSGRLVRIDAEGKAHDVAEINASYIWKLLVDPLGGILVATGTPGQVLHLKSDGTLQDRMELEVEHVTDIEWQGDSLLMATAMPARVISRTRKGRTKTLFDLGRSAEIHRIQPVPEGLFVAVNGEKHGRGVVPAPAKREKKLKPGAVDGPSKPTPGAGAFGRLEAESTQLKPPKGASLWFLGAGGRFHLVTSLGKQAILDLVPGQGDSMLVAMSKGGRIVRVDPRGKVEIVVDVAEAHIAALSSAGWLVTGGGASVQRFAPDASRARYYSRVRDAGAMVRIGHVDLVGEHVRLEVRTGSTHIVHSSSWTEFTKVPDLGGVPRVQPGRFVQFRATLGGANTHLRAVRLSYQAPNQAPMVHRVHVIDRKIKVGNSKAAVQKKRTRALRQASKVLNSAKAKHYTGIKRIGFDIQDLNGDFLVFEVSVRKIGDRVWVPLTPDEGTPLLFVDWKVADWPEGTYEIKVVASDAQDNPLGQGSLGETLGGPIRIDNSVPVVSDLSLRGGKVRFRVRDRGSKIRQVRIAIGRGPWQSVASNDGMIDSRDEFFAVDLEQLGVKSSTILRIQAQDSFGHFGRGGIEVRR